MVFIFLLCRHGLKIFEFCMHFKDKDGISWAKIREISKVRNILNFLILWSVKRTRSCWIKEGIYF